MNLKNEIKYVAIRFDGFVIKRLTLSLCGSTVGSVGTSRHRVCSTYLATYTIETGA